MHSIVQLLESSRQALLDLSTRNRLLNVPQNSKQAKVVEIVDELSAEILRLLVKENKQLTFLPGREKKKIEAAVETDAAFDDEIGELPQPEDDVVDERGIAQRHVDYRLQTLLTSEGLQKRLLTLFYDAITFEEEQGVNILYLAIGMLKWYEDDRSEVERYAPLVLIPVSLERGSASEKFKIKWRGEDPASNLTLQAKMKAEFGVQIPDLPEEDDMDLTGYFKTVQEAVSNKARFVVEENKMVLGFFSFAKFLMYRDLDIANWPANSKLEEHPLITGLMQNGFATEEGMISEDANVDQYLPVERLFHVVDADSSQTLAIEEVRRGRNLVIQGPPGTGKSQTITNIIASAVADGKKVLFVAEKMAALEVVQRRMNNIGLGPLCLELHSSKSNKRAILEELKRTRDLGKPKGVDGNGVTTRLQLLSSKLNDHVMQLHSKLTPADLTAYQVIGNLVRLKQGSVEARGIVLDRPEEWSTEDKLERTQLLNDVAARVREIGVPEQHIWCGVNRVQLLPNEYDRLCDLLSEVKDRFEQVLSDTEKVKKIFSVGEPILGSFKTGVTITNSVAAMPDADHTTLAFPGWENDWNYIEELVQNGSRLQELKSKLSGQVAEAAWTANLDDCRQQIAMHGESFFRFLNSSYKRSVALLKSVLTVPLSKDHQERIALLDDILATQRLGTSFTQKDILGKNVFGSRWQGMHSDWTQLSSILQWRKNTSVQDYPAGFMEQCSKLTDVDEWKKAAPVREKKVSEFFSAVRQLSDLLQLDISSAFNVADTDHITNASFAERLDSWLKNTESVTKWINFKMRYNRLAEMGLGSLAEKIWNGAVSADMIAGVFERAYFDAMAEMVFTQYPELRNFDGEQHMFDVNNFKSSDITRIEQTRIALREKHFGDIPHTDGGIGPLGVLNGEFAKKRNHLPIRQLIKKAGPVIQALKPVCMMSPLSVAQFLEPGALQFDLLVIDEASQVEPVDALGAVARAKQIVVVGDTRQLPPTRFFSRMTGNVAENEEDDDNTLATTDVESILSLCLAKGLPQRMLRWHYRSKHQSLIAVSNKEFYENKLFIVPSPYDVASGMGLKFNYFPNGIFDSGDTSINQVEAGAVARAVIEHARNSPDKSLGIGTFSIKQKQAIIDELELLRRSNPDTETFFTAHQDEPFFVKNLENIQGDERDVIFISVGYGKNRSGIMNMRFGPLSNDGGERRLNVLISRAKRKCEVFSSITADDIDLDRGKGAGVAALKLFLKFAQTGKLDFGKITERETDSIFEDQVADALRTKGFDVKTQIGIAGFFIDVAITDPERPGRFLLGIECDGASYHSSRSARDRDRLRQAVLEDHDWIIHRIWSTDWFRRPTEQMEKLLVAIEQAKQTLADREQAPEKVLVNNVFEIAANEEVLHVTVGQRELSVPYKEALLKVPLHLEPHEVQDADMATIVANIVEVETPVHENEIVARVRSLWNLARAGSRIQAKVKSGLDFAQRKSLVVKNGTFYSFPEASVRIRNRSLAISPGLKKPEYLPPQEIRKAIVSLIEANFGARRDQVITETGRLLGFKATSAQLKEVLDKEINELLTEKLVSENDNILSMAINQ